VSGTTGVTGTSAGSAQAERTQARDGNIMDAGGREIIRETIADSNTKRRTGDNLSSGASLII
jgi:hypothetical protein